MNLTSLVWHKIPMTDGILRIHVTCFGHPNWPATSTGKVYIHPSGCHIARGNTVQPRSTHFKVGQLSRIFSHRGAVSPNTKLANVSLGHVRHVRQPPANTSHFQTVSFPSPVIQSTFPFIITTLLSRVPHSQPSLNVVTKRCSLS